MDADTNGAQKELLEVYTNQRDAMRMNLRLRKENTEERSTYQLDGRKSGLGSPGHNPN
jgi:hypothetical protein